MGTGMHRKLALLTWLPQHLPTLWLEVRKADVVHCPVPGDFGVIGILIALFQRKLLFIRHCGTWGKPASIAERILNWLLEGIAGGRNLVLATGSSERPPSIKNSHIGWIFSTTLTRSELDRLSHATPWTPNQPLRLITVCRLTKLKNVQAIIRALPQIMKTIPTVRLDVLGDGEYRAALESLIAELDLEDFVTLHGNVAHDYVMKALAQAHLFVFPTQVNEGFPKAVLEAMACGLPIIAADVSSISHLIEDCGVLLPEATPDAVAHAVLDLTRAPHQLPRMSELAIERSRRYTLEAWKECIAQRLSFAWNVRTDDLL